LLYTPHLASPEGANIIYTDTVPLLAVAAKILYKTTGVWFNYLGLWIFACFPLLALFVALAIQEGRCKDPVAIIGGVLLALACPALLIRFGHAALMAHFLIVWSFFLYLQFKRTASLWKLTIQFAVLTSLCILLQVYFLLMVMPFFIASLLQGIMDKKLSLRSACFSAFFVFGGLLLTVFISGMIAKNAPDATQFGFGFYSMNLLSPILPVKAHLPQFISQHIHWDSKEYTWDATGGQGYEGYNYLGAGVILLLLLQLPVAKSLCRAIIKHHLFLFLGLLCLCLLALSNHIYLGNWQIINIPIGIKVFSYFRTSARMFWPVYYVLVVALTLITFKRFSPNTARMIIALAVILQLNDTHVLHQAIASNEGYPQELSRQTWNTLLASHQFIAQYPSFQCGGWANDWPANDSNMELLLLAAQQNKPTNSAYLARTSRNCFNEMDEAAQFNIQPGGLYIYGKIDHSLVREIQESPHFKEWCREFNHGFVCTRNTEALHALNKSQGFSMPVMINTPTYSLGEILHFTANGNGRPFLYRSWYNSEPGGTWSRGTISDITLKIANPSSNFYRMTINSHAFLSAKNPSKDIQVYLNNKKVAVWRYTESNTVQHVILFSKKLLANNHLLKITFVSDKAMSPREAGYSTDNRILSLGITDLIIEPKTS
jgi:hypothetical protein